MVIGIHNLLTYMQRKLQTLYCKGKFSLISAFFELEIFILDMFVLNFASQHCILYLYHAFSQCFQRKNGPPGIALAGSKRQNRRLTPAVIWLRSAS